MKLHNVIGGLEERVYNYALCGEEGDLEIGRDDSIKVLGHNQLCNKEVEVDREMITDIIYKISKSKEGDHKGFLHGHDFDNLAKAIAKAISQGKVIKVKE